jgi:hypothetical protein
MRVTGEVGMFETEGTTEAECHAEEHGSSKGEQKDSNSVKEGGNVDILSVESG